VTPREGQTDLQSIYIAATEGTLQLPKSFLLDVSRLCQTL